MNKKTKKYEVKIHYSGFCTYEILAENESEAILKARNLQINSKELLSNIDNWEEADIASEVQWGNLNILNKIVTHKNIVAINQIVLQKFYIYLFKF